MFNPITSESSFRCVCLNDRSVCDEIEFIYWGNFVTSLPSERRRENNITEISISLLSSMLLEKVKRLFIHFDRANVNWLPNRSIKINSQQSEHHHLEWNYSSLGTFKLAGWHEVAVSFSSSIETSVSVSKSSCATVAENLKLEISVEIGVSIQMVQFPIVKFRATFSNKWN